MQLLRRFSMGILYGFLLIIAARKASNHSSIFISNCFPDTHAVSAATVPAATITACSYCRSTQRTINHGFFDQSRKKSRQEQHNTYELLLLGYIRSYRMQLLRRNSSSTVSALRFMPVFPISRRERFSLDHAAGKAGRNSGIHMKNSAFGTAA